MTKEFTLSDLPFRARLTYIAHTFKAVFKQHHRPMMPLFRKLIPEDGVVLDVGGHAGQYAKLYAKIARNGHVYSFEPGSYARSILHRSLKGKNTTIIGDALGDALGELTLNIPVKKNGVVKYGVSHLGEGSDYPQMVSETVPVNTIDSFVQQHGLTRLDFIKADIEGWEQRMVMGGEQSIQKFKPNILVEMMDHQLNRAGDNLDGFWGLLLSWGYKPYISTADDVSNLKDVKSPMDGDIIWIAE